jgi:hypothetical protein
MSASLPLIRHEPRLGLTLALNQFFLCESAISPPRPIFVGNSNKHGPTISIHRRGMASSMEYTRRSPSAFIHLNTLNANRPEPDSLIHESVHIQRTRPPQPCETSQPLNKQRINHPSGSKPPPAFRDTSLLVLAGQSRPEGMNSASTSF